ncbi:hypothetical protein PENSPDRAFT_687430 [Peniophora sp. CONT]|nr:hypothetical protein PENSPDRAFT_687430 [Peniophora sp. CONT]
MSYFSTKILPFFSSNVLSYFCTNGHTTSTDPVTSPPEAEDQECSTTRDTHKRREVESRIFALVIGIDNYLAVAATPELPGAVAKAQPRTLNNISNLYGAVADANEVVTYLTEELGASKSRIVLLRNAEANRARILSELHNLRTNHDIRTGDPIVIYYAGHGTAADAPSDWQNGTRKVQFIVPYDAYTLLDPADSTSMIDPIPDRTLGALLFKLAQKNGMNSKGDNITVIFDCCHSGSGTRSLSPSSASEPTRRDRGFEQPEGWTMSPMLDRDIWKDVPVQRSALFEGGDSAGGLKSHVLLAACGPLEKAQEQYRRGAFTSALLTTLCRTGTETITYQQLLKELPIVPGQTPQFEGENTGRILFDARAPSQRRALYEVVKKKTGHLLKAGTIDGITASAEFDVYRTSHIKVEDKPLARMYAKDVRGFDSDIAPLDPGVAILPDVCFALQTSFSEAEQLRLHIASDKPALRDVRAAIDEEVRSGLQTVRVVDDRKLAHLSIAVSSGQVEYHIADESVLRYRHDRLYYRTPLPQLLDALRPVLDAATHFFRHLHRKPPTSSNIKLAEKVELGLFKVELSTDIDEDLAQQIFLPSGDNLIKDGVVEIETGPETQYGFTIKSNMDVHIALFYFDCSDLSITQYYGSDVQTVDTAKVSASLERGQTINIGHGRANRGAAQRYVLHEGQERDVGFLKLYVSTQYSNFAGIEQPSPFKPDTRYPVPVTPPRVSTWDTSLVAMIQKSPLMK